MTAALPARLAGRLPGLRVAARAGLVAEVGIVVTGAAVRLTGSGLGCPTWPRCSNDAFVPNGLRNTHPEVQQAVEFGNRLLTFVVLATAVMVVVAARRAGDRTDRRLAWAQPLGVVAQVVLGGVTVLVGLHPAAVAAHFLLSIGIVAAAVALVERTSPAPRVALPRELRAVALAGVPATVLLLAAGTVVTGAGPHAGDRSSPRFHVGITAVTQLHADLAWLVLGVALAAALGTRLVGHAGPVLRRRAAALLAVVLAQGVLGYVQYALRVPGALVGLHVLGACLTWVTAVRLALAARSPLAAASPAPEAPGADQRRSASTATAAKTTVR